MWLALRNRLIGDHRFQRWAGNFPLTRPFARRNVRSLFDLVAGFVYSQILAACVAAGLFDLLAEGPAEAAQLAGLMGLSEGAALRLLKSSTALRLTERLRDGRFVLGPLGAALRGNPAVQRMIEHHALLYADLSDPLALLRGDTASLRLPQFWSYTQSRDPQPGEVGAYSALMAQSQSFIASDILDSYPIARHRHLLDLGGGEGAFLREAARRAPSLAMTLFDLPAVAAHARERLAAEGLSERIHIRSGNFFADGFPGGADVMSLVRVLHDHDDAAVLMILRKARMALPPGGVLLIAEPFADVRGAEAAGEAYLGFYLAAMGRGRPRTVPELTAMAREAGFAKVKRVATRYPILVGLLVAQA